MKSEYFKNNVKLSILLIVVISVILLYGVCLFPMEYGSDIMKIILFCGVVFILYPFLKVYIDWISFYIFSRENNLWDKRVQRPRIFIYIIYFWILYFIVSSDMDGYYTLMANRFFLLFYLLIGAYFVGWLIWTRNFESVILSRTEKNVNNNITIDKLDSKEIITAKEENDVNNNITRNKLDSKEIERLVEDNKINIDESSKGDLEKLLRGEKIESKIKWIGTSGKKVITYTKIFILLPSIIEGGKEKFEGEKRKSLINFIISNFVKFENNKEKEIPFGSIDGSYSNFFSTKKTKKIV
jgi:hypothetical protein